jgi:hypothetical protein
MSTVSNRTIVFASVGIAAPVGAAIVLSSEMFGAVAETAWAVTDIVIVTVVAALLFVMAFRFPRGWRFRHQFTMMGAGAVLYALAGLGSLYSAAIGADSLPSISAMLYLAGMALLAGGVWSVARGFSVFAQTRAILGVCVALAAGCALTLYFAALADVAADTSLGLAARTLAVAQPTADLVLLLAPAMALTIVVTMVGGGRLTRPWWLLVLGFWGLTVTDTLHVLEAAGASHVSASPLDVGWWLSYALVAVGASVMVDLNHLSERSIIVVPAVQETEAGGG